MSKLDLDLQTKQEVDRFLDQLRQAKPEEIESFKRTFANGNTSSWKRFLIGAYNHPITWWIGIFQLQMQMGIWGHQYRGVANIRANTVQKLVTPLKNEIKSGLKGQSMPIITALIRYNMKYKKADMLGRVAGGMFTSYGITGGRLGSKSLSGKAKLGKNFTIFLVSSYGAAIKAAATGQATLQTLIQSILTGSPTRVPYSAFLNAEGNLSQEEQEIEQALKIALSELGEFAYLSPAPVSMKDFCLKKENANLRGLCQ